MRIKQHFTALSVGFLIILTGVLLTFERSADYDENRTKVSAAYVEFPVLVSGYFLNQQLLDFHLPFESAPAPKDQQDRNDKELEDDANDDLNPSFLNHDEASVLDNAIDTRFIYTSKSCTQNRSSVPFFILYHSWKSYLS